MQASKLKMTPMRTLGVFIACGALIAGCAGNSSKPMSQDSNEVSSAQITNTPMADATQQTPLQNPEVKAPLQPIADAATEATTVQSQPIADKQAADEHAQTETDTTSQKSMASIEPAQDTFYFGVNKSTLDAKDKDVLREHASFLMANPGLVLEINGHTDSTGPHAYNEYLSKKRAEAVAKVLIEAGVTRSQLVINARADSKPLSGQNDPAKNRRVQLQYDDMSMLSSK